MQNQEFSKSLKQENPARGGGGPLEDLPSFDEHMELDKETLNQKILTAKDKTLEERLNAIHEIENKEAIEQIAYADRDADVRLAALERVTNLKLLAEMVDDENEKISDAARERLISLLQNKN